MERLIRKKTDFDKKGEGGDDSKKEVEERKLGSWDISFQH